MKKAIIIIVLFSLSLPLFSQKVIEEVKLSNGRTIVVYDDNTWKYKDTNNKLYPREIEKIDDSTLKEKPLPRALSNSSQSNNSTNDNSTTTTSKRKTNESSKKSSYSSMCGARTKKGTSCQRRVSGGGRCWQHGG